MCDRYLIQSTCIQYSTESYLIDLRKAYRDRLSTLNNTTIWKIIRMTIDRAKNK